MIDAVGEGVVVYLRQEGRGIGMINKLKAYTLQDKGFDTVEANEKLGFPADLRNYGVGAQILNDLGIHNIKLITNNPRKIAGLKGYGLDVVCRVPLLIEATSFNMTYLNTKAAKLGHMLLQTYLLTVSIQWNDEATEDERYERLEKLRHLADTEHLLLQEETRPVATAIFGDSMLVVHLGLDQPNVADADWFIQTGHPYMGAIAHILEDLKTWPQVARFEFLISPGTDPFKTLQIKLDREDVDANDLTQSALNHLETQRIYTVSL
jgi:3,4-dihydroxy 2-butanone 4-phosphate synthase / GTP cyclohydrolase II